MVDVHPQYLEKDGEKQFVVLPYFEFRAIEERLDELEDLVALFRAREENQGKRSYSIDEVREELGLPRSEG
ncbi:MAG: type II toxin-antitoxin system Phd/YefM family antitoxin [Holophagales bacterium]|nr:MAG: type II toxin-antitoxin system Phd/YefM family antitoxin [Holophagales bacterium]